MDSTSMNNKMEGRPPMRPAVRANSSPVSAAVPTMRPKLPPRSVDDSISRRFPRDSDLFSPVITTGASSRISRIPDDTSIRRELNNDYGPELDQVGVPAVWDRRTSDIIPNAPYRPPGSSNDSLDFVNDLDVQAVDDIGNDGTLFSPPLKNEDDFATAPNPGYISERRGNGISRTLSSEPETSVGSTTAEKKVTIPRGMAFSRLRKSASEMTPRNAALPPRPPRSSTHPKSTKKEAPSEVENRKIAPPAEEVKAYDGDGFVTPRTENREDYEGAIRTRRARNEVASPSTSVGEASVPALERKLISTPIPSNHDSQPLIETIRQTIVSEIDAVRQDLRGDLLNIHTELVLTSSRQTREIQEMFSERDKLIKSLLQDMAELRKENAELRAFIADE